MSTPNFSALLARHRAYFRTGVTRSAQWREAQLTALRAMMTDRMVAATLRCPSHPEVGALRFRRVDYDVETTIRKIHAIPELADFLGDRLRDGR